jgi:acyl carrier protein
MNHGEIVQALTTYVIREILDGRGMGLDGATPLLEWGIMNSIEIAKLVTFVYQKLNVRIPAERISAEHFKDLDSIATLICDLGTPPGERPGSPR